MRDGLKIIRKFATEAEANLALSLLQSAGLAAELATDNCDGMYPQLDLLVGVALLVPAADEEQARELLENEAEPVQKTPWDCPACGEHIEAGFDTCWKCGASSPDRSQQP